VTPTIVTPLAKLVARAQARQEGWLLPTSLQFPNRNPGNLMDLQYFKETKKFRLNQFVSWEAGWGALATLIQKQLINRKLTLLQFIGGQRDSQGNVVPGGYSGFAPQGHGGNDPKIYAGNVASFIGVSPTLPASLDWLVVAKPQVKLPLFGATQFTEISMDL
jgi:hypothetical protein